eukprot:gene36889-48119_t
MKVHNAVVSVIEAGCLAVVHLSLYEPNRVLLRSTGVHEVIIESLSAHTSNSILITHACRAIHLIGNQSPESKAHFGLCGACESVVLGLRTHLTDPNVAEAACGAIFILGGHEDNKLRLGTNGSCESLMAILS